MNEVVEPTGDAEHDLVAAWKKSRSGAWAGRGYHYQHLVSTLILVRQWAGLAPSGSLVPEGLDDCVIELAGRDIWIQIKSRQDGTFSSTEVQNFLGEIDSKAASLKSIKEICTAVILEQTCPGENGYGIDQLFEDTTEKVFISKAPHDEIFKLISNQLDAAEVIVEGIASALYMQVAEAAQANASLPFEKRRRISTTEVEQRISERLEAEDPSAVDSAIISGALEPIDFNTPVNEPSFYQGVKVSSGHVAAGLVFDRPGDTNNIVKKLKLRRHVLVSGPSGAGKSALMWLTAKDLAGEFRWFQITGIATMTHADAIVRFIRARRPTETSPIGLAFDEVGSVSSDLWNALVRELRSLPSVYFLGSVRQEDVALITNQSDTEFITVKLDENLARTVWEKLSARKQTEWHHWREPFEISEGLMLEYVHVLTQGQRLADVIGEQVRQRELEDRHDELAIIRNTAVLCACGGEVDARKLFELLGIEPNVASHSLKRLIDEHLVRESRPGVLGGLHMLRSEALSKASHDESVFLTADSLWQALPAATSETLPRVVQSFLAEATSEFETEALKKLAETLSSSSDIDVWVAILTGLGLATLERHVISFMKTLDKHGVPRAHWPLAGMYADPHLDIPGLSEFEQWQSLRNAILAFRALPKHDLRPACLKQLPEESALPNCNNLIQANRLLSCLVPICGGEPVRIKLVPDFMDIEEQDIREIAAMLSTAYLIDPYLADSLIKSLGGEQFLFDLFLSQTPWATAPMVEPNGTHGRTVHSNWFHAAEQYQPDPHEAICNICEILLAISPHAEAAASDVVNPIGQTVTVGDFTPWAKDMPRQNVPAKARVAWNVAFRKIMLARSAVDSLTEYSRQMAQLVKRTEKAFRSISEKWLQGKNISNPDSLATEMKEIFDAANELTYVSPENPSSVMTTPGQSSGADDSLGALLTGVLGNLVRRLNDIQKARAAATFAGSLAAQAKEHSQSHIWRMISSPPSKELAVFSRRLDDVACVLHEMAHDSNSAAIQKIVNAALKSIPGNALHTAAAYCRSLADQRFHERLRTLEGALKEKGWNARCWSRPTNESGSVYWPAREIAVLVEITNFEIDAHYLEDCLVLGNQLLGNDWPFSIAPVINGRVLASMAFLPSSQMPLPDYDFAQKWQDHIDQPFLSSETLEKFDEARAACVQLSGIMMCRDLENLHPKEEEVFSSAIKSFERNQDIIAEAAEKTGLEHFKLALDYIERYWNQVHDEFENTKAGRETTEPLCMLEHLALTDHNNERVAELASVRILILQSEALSA